MAESTTTLSTGGGSVSVATFVDAAGNAAFGHVPLVGSPPAPLSSNNTMPVTDSAVVTALGTLNSVVASLATEDVGLATAAGQANALGQATATAVAAGTPADAAYTGTGSASLVALMKGLYTKLAGTLTTTVSNFPTIQAVSGAVSISNLPVTQAVSGAVSISNLPTTQPVSGSVAVTNGVTVTQTVVTITTANADQILLSANPVRKSLAILVNSTASVNINYGTAATASNLAYGSSSNFGYGRTWGVGDGVPTQAIHGFSATAGAVVVIEEGV